MRKWRVSYRAINNLYVPEYRDFLFWHEMDMKPEVKNYLVGSCISISTIHKDDMHYYWSFHSLDDAISAIRENSFYDKVREKRKKESLFKTLFLYVILLERL